MPAPAPSPLVRPQDPPLSTLLGDRALLADLVEEGLSLRHLFTLFRCALGEDRRDAR